MREVVIRPRIAHHWCMNGANDLTGQLLIASPGMEDPRFAGSIVYICVHGDDGAMGLIVNKPTPQVRFVDLLEQLDVVAKGDLPDVRVHFGGPVETSRGFVLHSADVDLGDATLRVDDEFAMTASIEMLDRIAGGQGPRSSLLALGYSGWDAGQLEGEIAQNGWLTAPASPDLVFGRAHEFKWGGALKSIGIEPSMLSGEAGRA